MNSPRHEAFGGRPLLLAPAGSLGVVRAALASGADAVYAGLSGWSRGGSRRELDVDELQTAQREALAAGRELQVALNTIPKPEERRRLREVLPRLLDIGIRTVIVNDLGLLASLRRRFGGLRLTASIGCGARTVADVAFYRDLGADAVVLPGTVSPAEAGEITAVGGISVEIMIHMAEEFVLLGKCWMPSYLHLKPLAHEDGGEPLPAVRLTGSVKRGGVGACYRICQQPWELFDGDRHADTRLLPSRQISRVGDVQAYAEAGVEVLKLQGRSLPPGDLARLVRRYRDAIDSRPAALPDEGSPLLPAAWTVLGR